MKPHKILKFLREKKGLSQRKLAELSGLTKSTYARFEKGEQVVDFISLLKLLDNLDATMKDYTELLDIDDEFKNHQEKIRWAIKNKDAKLIRQLTMYFSNNRNSNLKYYTYYISLYSHLQKDFPDLFITEEQLKKEIHNRFEIILNSEYITTTDYKFTANALIYTVEEQKKTIIEHTIFSPDIISFSSKGETIQLAIAQLLNNYIDRLITEKKLEMTDKYIQKQYEILSNYPSQQFSTLLKFHEARIIYIKKPSKKNEQLLNNIIDYYEMIDYKDHIISLSRDLKELKDPSFANNNPNVISSWN